MDQARGQTPRNKIKRDVGKTSKGADAQNKSNAVVDGSFPASEVAVGKLRQRRRGEAI